MASEMRDARSGKSCVARQGRVSVAENRKTEGRARNHLGDSDVSADGDHHAKDVGDADLKRNAASVDILS